MTKLEELKQQRAEIDRQIKEIEQEYRRGRVKIINTRCGPNRENHAVSLRWDKNEKGYWKTLITVDSMKNMQEIIKILISDMTDVLEALQNKEVE